MNYQSFSPGPLFERYIKCYWTLESDAYVSDGSRERIFPDGCVELIFHFGDRFKKFSPTDAGQVQSRAFIHGQLTEFIELQPTGKTGIFAVRFKPFGLKPFIPVDLREMTGITVNVSDIWGNDGDALEDKMLNAKDHAQRISILETFLHKKLQQNFSSQGQLEWCVEQILSSNGNVTIDELADDACLGRRQLERKFVSGVGLSPKMLSRIVRFQNTLNLIEKKQFSSLTVIAYEGGFYDQAHFIKDFKEFTGLNPKKYFAENHELVRYFNLV